MRHISMRPPNAAPRHFLCLSHIWTNHVTRVIAPSRGSTSLLPRFVCMYKWDIHDKYRTPSEGSASPLPMCVCIYTNMSCQTYEWVVSRIRGSASPSPTPMFVWLINELCDTCHSVPCRQHLASLNVCLHIQNELCVTCGSSMWHTWTSHATNMSNDAFILLTRWGSE